MTRKEFFEQVKKNDWEVYTSDQVASFVKDEVFNKSLSEEDREVAAIEYSSLKKQEVINEDMTKSIFYYRESQVKTEDSTLMKAKKGYDIGTIKEFGGRKYIKTDGGWKYYSNKGQSQEKEKEPEEKKESKAKREPKEKKTITTLLSLSEQAAAASNNQLQSAALDKNTSKEVKEAALGEIEKRQGPTLKKKGIKKLFPLNFEDILQINGTYTIVDANNFNRQDSDLYFVKDGKFYSDSSGVAMEDFQLEEEQESFDEEYDPSYFALMSEDESNKFFSSIE